MSPYATLSPCKKRQKDVEENNHCNSLAIELTTKVCVMVSNGMSCSRYCSDVGPLFAATEFYMLQTSGSETAPEMSPLRHFEDQRRKSWCAVVVLAAVCSLTVSVATRYSSSWDVSAPTVKTVQSAHDAGGETAASRQGCGQLGASAGLFRCLAISQFLSPNRACRTSHAKHPS